jgi:MoxR-like ATPase
MQQDLEKILREELEFVKAGKKSELLHNLNFYLLIHSSYKICKENYIDFDFREDYWWKPEVRLLGKYYAKFFHDNFIPPPELRKVFIKIFELGKKARADGVLDFTPKKNADIDADIFKRVGKVLSEIIRKSNLDSLEVRQKNPEILNGYNTIAEHLAEFIEKFSSGEEPAKMNSNLYKRFRFLPYQMAGGEEELKKATFFFNGLYTLFSSTNAYQVGGAQSFGPILGNCSSKLLLEPVQNWISGKSILEVKFIGKDSRSMEASDKSELYPVLEIYGQCRLHVIPFLNSAVKKSYKELFEIEEDDRIIIQEKTGKSIHEFLEKNDSLVQEFAEVWDKLLQIAKDNFELWFKAEKIKKKKLEAQYESQTLNEDVFQNYKRHISEIGTKFSSGEKAQALSHLLLDNKYYKFKKDIQEEELEIEISPEKKEITKAIQNSPFCNPLYLPQIYWLILRNAKAFEKIKTEFNFRKTWEAEYLAVCSALGIKSKNEEKGPFWTNSIQNEITLINGSDMVERLIEENKPLNKLFYITGRKDQRIKMPCEAIGLIAHDERRLLDDKPTPFFFSIINDSGCMAAVRILARLFSIPYPTVEFLKVSPSQLIDFKAKGINEKDLYLKAVPRDLSNQSIATYSLATFTNALYSWFPDNRPSSTHLIPQEIVEVVREFPPEENEEWRMTDPESDLVASLAGVAIKLLKKNKEVSDEMKESIVAKLSKVATSKVNIKPQNLILIGPPGTGKTRIANVIANEILLGRDLNAGYIKKLCKKQVLSQTFNPNILHIQFHPSYGYEDFVEGFRPVPNLEKSSTVRYSVVPGPFKVASQLARLYSDRNFKISITIFIDPQNQCLIIPREYDLYNLDKRKGVFSLKVNKDAESFLLDPENLNLKVPDNWPKGYLDVFWKPSEINGDQQFIVLIDELNRGNPASIFGELLSLIEPSKRIGQNEQMELILPVSKEHILVPRNFHVIATMNLADRSLAMLDQAFRRRFKFFHMKPDFSLIRDKKIFTEITGVENPDEGLNSMVANHFEAINLALEDCQISSERFIGHSYPFQLLSLVYKEGFTVEQATKELWDNELHPLVREILGEDKDTITNFAQKLEEHSKELTGLISYLISTSIRKYLQDASVPEIIWEKKAA